MEYSIEWMVGITGELFFFKISLNPARFAEKLCFPEAAVRNCKQPDFCRVNSSNFCINGAIYRE
jgi:hypothetical protein